MKKDLRPAHYGGADTNYAVTDEVIALAKKRLGNMPRFWGRYFKTPANKSAEQYHAKTESQVLRQHDIYVLPIARQTNRVNGTSEDGVIDARGNAAALFEAFGKSFLEARNARSLVFLDVEEKVPMSSAYYSGWARALVDASIGSPALAPAVYGSVSATATWKALARAMVDGAQCHGLWVARYTQGGGCVPTPEWSDKLTTPKELPAQCPVLAWQYSGECEGADYSLVNPTQETVLMSSLILPPAALMGAPDADITTDGALANGLTDRLRAALSNTIGQLREYSDDGKLPSGKPYLFPDGIQNINVELKFGDNANIRVTVSGT